MSPQTSRRSFLFGAAAAVVCAGVAGGAATADAAPLTPPSFDAITADLDAGSNAHVHEAGGGYYHKRGYGRRHKRGWRRRHARGPVRIIERPCSTRIVRRTRFGKVVRVIRHCGYRGHRYY